MVFALLHKWNLLTRIYCNNNYCWRKNKTFTHSVLACVWWAVSSDWGVCTGFSRGLQFFSPLWCVPMHNIEIFYKFSQKNNAQSQWESFSWKKSIKLLIWLRHESTVEGCRPMRVTHGKRLRIFDKSLIYAIINASDIMQRLRYAKRRKRKSYRASRSFASKHWWQSETVKN